jgi:hypothetical protein
VPVIAIHALVMATVVQMSSRIAGAKDTVRQPLRSTTVMIATARHRLRTVHQSTPW